jgi:hypothetical protein
MRLCCDGYLLYVIINKTHFLVTKSGPVLKTQRSQLKVGTLVTLPRTVTSYRDSVDGTRNRITYQKLVTR